MVFKLNKCKIDHANFTNRVSFLLSILLGKSALIQTPLAQVHLAFNQHEVAKTLKWPKWYRIVKVKFSFFIYHERSFSWIPRYEFSFSKIKRNYLKHVFILYKFSYLRTNYITQILKLPLLWRALSDLPYINKFWHVFEFEHFHMH